MKKVIIVIFLFYTAVDASIGSYMSSAWNQYQAVASYYGNRFDDAQKSLEQAVIDYPHDEQLNYNLGCIYHKQHKEQEALNCFNRAALTSDHELVEQSYFNMGNSQIALNNTDAAISSYEKVLSLNPQNKEAKHNLEVIKRKKEQEKQEKKDNKSKDDKQKNKDQQQDQNNNQQDNQQKGDQQDQQQQNKNQQKNNEKNASQLSQQDQEHKQDKKNDQQQSQNGNKPEEQKTSESGKQQHQDEQRDDQTGEGKEKKPQKQNKSSVAASQKNEPLQSKQLSATYDKQADNEKLDKQLQLVLKDAETNDEEQYKQMIKAHVKREMPSKLGQKNW